MCSHSVETVVDLRNAHSQQFFQARVNRAAAHGRLQQLHTLLHQCRAMSHSAKQRGHAGERQRFVLGKRYIFNRWYTRHWLQTSFRYCKRSVRHYCNGQGKVAQYVTDNRSVTNRETRATARVAPTILRNGSRNPSIVGTTLAVALAPKYTIRIQYIESEISRI